MQAVTGKSLPWIIGSVALMAVVGTIVAGIVLPAGAFQAATPAPDNFSTESIPVTNSASIPITHPAGANNLPAPSKSQSVIDLTNGSSSVSQQAGAPASIELSPAEDWNPIKTQHTFTVTVKRADGSPASGAAVELILNRFGAAVGDIVDIGGNNPKKVDNTYGTVTTNSSGQATLTITATREGDTDVTAYAPGIADADAHKVFAVKHWIDMAVDFPDAEATNQAGAPHQMTVVVYKSSDGKDIDGNPVTPLPGVEVSWALTDSDPGASLSQTSTVTDENGVTTVTLQQASPDTGDNTVDIAVKDQQNRATFTHTVTKTWVAQDIVVEKEGPATLGLLGQGSYQITVTNNGSATAPDVQLVDQLPDGLQYVSATPQPDQNINNTLSWSLGDIAIGESASVTLTLQGIGIGNQDNTATAVSGAYSGKDTHSTRVLAGSLMVSKTGPGQINFNEEFTYEVTVTNNGNGALTNVVVTDALPTEFTLVSSAPAAATTTTGPTWNLGTLTQGESKSVSLTVSSATAGNYVNRVSVTSDEGQTGGAEAATTVQSPTVTITKTANPGTILVGQQSTFTITATNNGDGFASNVRVVDTLPDGMEMVSTTPQATVGSDGSLSWTIDSLGGAGASETFTIVAQGNSGGSLVNRATISGDGVADTAEATVVVQTTSIGLEKTGGSVMYIGGERDYQITATNSGTANLTGVVITDTIPDGLSYVRSENGIFNANTVTWTVGELAAGASTTVTLTMRGEAAGEFTNEAGVTTDQGVGANANFEVAVLAAAGATLQLSDNPDPVGVGERVTYTATLTNQSPNSSITNVRVTVDIPTEFTILDAGTATATNNSIVFPVIDTLGIGETQTYTIMVQAIDAGDVVAQATLVYDEFSQPIIAQEGTTIVAR